MLTKEAVEEYIWYEPTFGLFFWVKDTNIRGPRKVGGQAGGLNSLGYWQIGLFGQRMLGHRLAWLITHGYMPDYIDHRDGNPSNNRLSNLRDATQLQNLANADFGDTRGIEAHGAKYRVRIVVNGERIEVGSFDTFEQAKVAQREAFDKYFGEFAFYNRQD